MSDSERDAIDSEAQKFIEASQDRINSLRKHCQCVCVCMYCVLCAQWNPSNDSPELGVPLETPSCLK